ncbi:MAG TPA: Hsp20 family protein [Terriglobales bacterium]|nr:Hsp20 family protein [Terriglobales bacterium]
MSPQSATAMQPIKGQTLAKQTGPMSIFDRMQEIHDSIARRAFELFEGSGRWSGRELDDWLRAESEMLHPIHLELTDSDTHLNVRAEVPGFTSKELEINVEPRRLTVSGKHETKEETRKGKTIYSELCAGEILRVVDLPAEVDTSSVTATLKDGVLNIKMAKTPAPKSVRVELKNA